MAKRIGVLALQGAVAEHLQMLRSLGQTALAIKHPEELEALEGLILPGGESTAIGKLMERYGFVPAIRKFAANGGAILGTCAGMVLLAGGEEEGRLGLIDMDVVRNGFGRQRESFEAELPVIGLPSPFPAVFIRAPYVSRTSAEVLAEVDGKTVLLRDGNRFACSFHPELTGDPRIFELFLSAVQS